MTRHNSAPGTGEAQHPNTYVGAPIERVEDLRFLRGRGCYLDDLSRPGQWHAAFVRSPFAHGAVRRIDTRAALAMPGVRWASNSLSFDCQFTHRPMKAPN